MVWYLEEEITKLKAKRPGEYKWFVELRGPKFHLRVVRIEDEREHIILEAPLTETGIMNLYYFPFKGDRCEVEFFL